MSVYPSTPFSWVGRRVRYGWMWIGRQLFFVVFISYLQREKRTTCAFCKDIPSMDIPALNLLALGRVVPKTCRKDQCLRKSRKLCRDDVHKRFPLCFCQLVNVNTAEVCYDVSPTKPVLRSDSESRILSYNIPETCNLAAGPRLSLIDGTKL